MDDADDTLGLRRLEARADGLPVRNVDNGRFHFCPSIIRATSAHVSTTEMNFPSVVLIRQRAPSASVLFCPGVVGPCRLVTVRELSRISRPVGPCRRSRATTTTI